MSQPPPIDPPGDANSGLLVAVDPSTTDPIQRDDGKGIAWDNNNEYRKFLIDDNTLNPDTADKELWEQSLRLVKQGLYWITDRIYQLRGFDIAQMTIVQGQEGIIIIDPLISKECARAALNLYNNYFYPDPQATPPPPTTAIIFSHSHIDHYGGAEGVLPSSGKCEIIAPIGFMEHAVSENVYVGNAMNRRANYSYGDQIPKDTMYQIGTGIGMTSSSGTSTIIKPTLTIEKNGVVPVDGVNIHFQLTPNTEAPAEMNFHFPDFKALCIPENANKTMHNIQTLRGALVRDAHMWSKYLDQAIQMFAAETDVVFGSHNWATWGREEVRDFLVCQRDMYAYLHDQTLRRLNEGQTGLEIAEDFKLPVSLGKNDHCKGFYGSVSHNVKAIYNRYMGWFDGIPAHLWEYPPVEAGTYYLECMGGAQGVLGLAEGYITKGNLRFAATLLSHAVFATGPSESSVRSRLADVYEQLGYNARCGAWRNFYLVGAYELRNGIQAPDKGTVDVASMMALDLEDLMDTMAIRLDGPNVPPADPRDPESQPFNIEFDVMSESEPHIQEDRIVLTLSNSALTSRRPIAMPLKTTASDTVGLVCQLTHKQLVDLVMTTITIDDVHYTGNPALWTRLMSYLTTPPPDFAIVTAEVEL